MVSQTSEFLDDDFQVICKTRILGLFFYFWRILHLLMEDKGGTCWLFPLTFWNEQASTHYLAGKGILEFGMPGDKARHGTEGCNSKGALKSTSSLVFLVECWIHSNEVLCTSLQKRRIVMTNPGKCYKINGALDALEWSKHMNKVFQYSLLVGGFKDFLFSPLFGEDSHFD